ncbi:hypothetical protein Taro_000074 [Colocasia esculenta]|uniref:Inactive poly [ADP-ribose] polymerase SRO3 n=1 Tax=Colocasia esculenta TaxID=4460 RepID=A0A843TFN3_COLES|nr:hypothetical protein [Colocasia esculenta]
MEATGCFKKSTATPARAPLRPGVAAAVVRESPFDDTASSAGPKCAVAGGSGQQPRGQAVALQTLGLGSEATLVRDFLRFKSSAAPSRVLFFAGGGWRDFPPAVVELMSEGFLAGKALMDVKLGDSLFLFDFARMLRIDVATTGRSSIAWIDVNGRCFFPAEFVETSDVHPKIETTVRTSENSGAAALPVEFNEGKNLSQERVGGHSDESQVVPVAGPLERQRWPGAQVLDQGDKMYKVIENIFLTGMRKCVPWTAITSISKCSYMGLSGNGRLKAFMAQLEMTKSARGDAHVKAGWYGASASNVTSIISHGFGQPNNRSLGPEVHAIGVYLAVQDCPHASSLLAEADNVGEKHVIFCRIITGNVEKINAYRPQCHPSTDEFDCGVDDLEKPKWYVVWSTHMNAHLLPEYIVSFKTFVSGPALMEASGKQLPKLPLSFPKLFAELGNSLPSTSVQALEILYERVKVEKIPKDIFVRKLREIAGEKLLATTFQKYRKGL